ncbi:hypothetical protein BKA61DRAFT_426900, partial [Leptodontidium sp. MPI-SDFR-AT-0119]
LEEMLHSALFSKRTFITVAHRINIVINSDRIVVLRNCEVTEFDTPAELISQEGLFYKLVKEAGLLESV